MAGPDPAGRGGIQTASRLIAQRCGRFADVEVVATHRGGSPASRAATAITGTARVLGRLALRRVDVLHLHVAKRGSIVRKGALTLLARAFRVPVVLHCHGGMFERDFRRMPRLLQRLVSGVFRRAQAVIVLSNSWQAVYLEQVRVPAEKLVVAMNGVELPDVVQQRPHSPLVVVFLGKLGPQKGAWDVIRAVGDLPPAVRAGVRVVLAGDGDVEGTRSLVRQHGLTEVVEVWDWIDPVERDRLLARSSVFVLPSPHEGLPMAMLEAMAWGVVPVVSSVGGIPEVVSDGVNGLLVSPGDVTQLATALCRLVAAPDLVARLSAAARLSVDSRGADAYANRIAAIWRSVHEAECDRTIAVRRGRSRRP
jgi:glycosyltransferase involved in cell wall biosynthesis